MSETKPFRDQWYVVHVLSGQENKVATGSCATRKPKR